MTPYSSSYWREKNWPAGLPKELTFNRGPYPLFKYLAYHAEEIPDRPALVFYGKEISYREWHEMSNSFAQYLVDRGLKKGDRVGLFMPSFPGFAICYMGISKAGGVICACSPAFKESELEYQLRDAEVSFLICLDQLMDVAGSVRERLNIPEIVLTGYRDFLDPSNMDGVPAPIAKERSYFRNTVELLDILKKYPSGQPDIGINLEEDLALLQYSGGTTGLPKGAMHTFYNQIYKSASLAEIFLHNLYRGENSNQAILQLFAMYHIGGMIYFNAYLYRGLSQIIIPQFNPLETMRSIDRYRPEAIWTSTPMILAMLQHPDIGKYNLHSIKRIRVSGTTGITLTEQIAKQLRIHLGEEPEITEASYGLTETHTGDTFMPLDKPNKWGSVGIPAYGSEIKIVSLDDRKEILGPGHAGEIAVLSASNFKGYWKNPEKTAETLIDGWVFTGDVGRFDDDGYLYFLGRRKEMIKVSGYSVFPEEVERILSQHVAIESCGVKGVADERKGEVVKAVVVLKEEFVGKVNPEELIEWAEKKMSYYKAPKFIEIRDSLPTHRGTGKILRRLL